MAPAKFGLFKARSRDNPDQQPSTENLLHNSNSCDHVPQPSSPKASTSADIDIPEHGGYRQVNIHVQVQYGQEEQPVRPRKKRLLPTVPPTRRLSASSDHEDSQMDYKPLKDGATSISTPNSDQEDYTLCDAVSLQFDEVHFDEASITPIEDLSTKVCSEASIAPIEDLPTKVCGETSKKNKRTVKVVKESVRLPLKDSDMWEASNVEVMRNLLFKNGTYDERIKWEAIATARGLCTLKDSCTCNDCGRPKYLSQVTDGDGGLGAAPLFSAINFGCQVQ